MTNVWRTNTARLILLVIACLLTIFVITIPAAAQDRVVSDDEVNAVAEQLYCPVCENIPLDTCGTAACRDWREEIRSQLASGMTEEEVITRFVARYGDRVVGTPMDPMLRALSLLTPWVLGAIIVLGALWTFLRWRTGQATATGQTVADTMADTASTVRDDEYYRTRLEQDLQSRR
jgi:cytochrome c-type biogenesis protein CcmH